jgi:hypothetical protein
MRGDMSCKHQVTARQQYSEHKGPDGVSSTHGFIIAHFGLAECNLLLIQPAGR